MSNKFNTLEHHCTTYNVAGFPIKIKPGYENNQILSNQIRVPPQWINKPKISSLSDLHKHRADSKKVDPSYDLTGDGTVSIREYRLARQFDKDRNGILDAKERKECLQAIKDGIEFPKVTIGKVEPIERYTRSKMLSERKHKDKSFVVKKWAEIMDLKDG